MSELIVSEVSSPKNSVKILSLSGEMDEQSIDSLKKIVDDVAAAPDLTYLLLEMSNLDFINSKGIGYLVSVHTHLSKFRKSVILASAKEAVMDVITLVGLTTIIRYFETAEEALNNL